MLPCRAYAALLACVLPVSVVAKLDSLSLNGEWGLTLDAHPNNWWLMPGQPSSPPAFNHSSNSTIQLPGRSVGAAGFGDGGPGRKHAYTGSVLYTKSVSLPAGWAAGGAAAAAAAASSSLSVALTFGGVFRSMQLWVNGEAAGTHYGYMDPFEFDITAQVRRQLASSGGGAATTLEIVARVSGSKSALNGDGLSGCFDWGDGLSSMVGGWMGIWGDVAVVARHRQLATEDLHIRLLRHEPPRHGGATDATVSVGGTVSAEAATDESLTRGVVLSCTVHAHIPGLGQGPEPIATVFEAPLADLLILRNSEDQAAAAAMAGETRRTAFAFELDLSHVQLWGPGTPALYYATVTLRSADGSLLDSARERFGLRTIVVDGPFFLLNGKRHFMSGMGDDFGYETEAPPMNSSVYAARFATFKSFGFNYIRLHSHWEAPGYYAAADEAGFFVSSNLPENCAQPACTNLTLRTWKAMIKTHRNHPSIFDNGMGNEHCEFDRVERDPM